MVIAFFSVFIAKPKIILPEVETSKCARVAILYLTMNDFREEAVISCLNQDYPDFDVYILDDSADMEWQSRVEQFALLHKRVKVIRRQNRENFKAGNLNHVLEQIHQDYEYFAVSDSDGILPRDFLKKLMPYFAWDKRIGFVQANQRWNPEQNSAFARDLGMNTDLALLR